MNAEVQKSLFFLLSIVLWSSVVVATYFTIKKRAEVVLLEETCQKARAEMRNLSSGALPSMKEKCERLEQKLKDYEREYGIHVSGKKEFKLNILGGRAPKNEVDFYFFLMSFVQLLTDRACELGVNIPKEFAFGFGPYVKKDLIPDRGYISKLYEQSEIIAQLMLLLYESNGRDLDVENVMRESVDHLDSKGENARKKDNVNTIRANGEILLRKGNSRSYIFTLNFATYTDGLRNFINKLREYKLPVVIRSLAINETAETATKDIVMETKKVKVALGLEWILSESDLQETRNINKNDENI